MRERSRLSLTISASLLVLFLMQGCLAYSSFQSARIIEKGRPHSMVGASRTLGTEMDDAIWTLNGDMRFGLNPQLDWSFRMSVFTSNALEGGGALIGGDIRAGVIPDHLTFALPVSIILGDFMFYSTRVQPGFIGTQPLAKNLDLNAAARASFFLIAPGSFDMTYNAGLGITTPSGRWTIHPEIAVFHNVGQNEMLAQFGIGVERNFVDADIIMR